MVLAKQTYKLRAKSTDNSKEWEDRFDDLKQEAEESLKRAEEGYKKATENSEKLLQEHMAIERLDTNIGEINTNIGEINTNIGDINTNIGEVNDRVHSVTTDLSNVKTDIENLDTNIGTINTDIGGIRDNIGTINTDIHAINNRLKAPNLINNPEPMFQLKDYPFSQNSQNVDGWAKMDSRVKNKEIIQKDMQMLDVTKGKKYTVQVEVQTDAVLNNITFSFYTQSNNTHNTVEATLTDLGDGHYIAYASWVANVNSQMRAFNIKTLDFTGEYIQFRHPKLEEGNYTPYYLDGKFTTESVKRLEQTSDGLIAEVSSMQISNPNLLGEKEPMVQLRSYPGDATSTDENGWAKFNNTCQNKEILPSTDIWLDVVENKRYTQQIEVQTDGKLKGLSFTFFTKDGTHNEVIANVKQQSNNSWVAYGTWDCAVNKKVRCIDIKSITIEGGTYVQFRHPKIEEGNYTPYSMKDTIQGLENNVSRLEMTTNGMQSTVTNNKDKITQITQTVDGLNSTVKDFKYNENLLFSPDNFLDTNYWRVEEGYQGVEVKKDCVSFGVQSGSRSFRYDLSKIKKPLPTEKKTYTLSFDMKLSEDYDMTTENLRNQKFEARVMANGSILFREYFDYLVERKGLSKEKWVRFSETGAISSYYDPQVQFGTYQQKDIDYPGKVMIRNIKLEEGDVATGMESISQQVSQITQTVGGISHRVESIENMNNGNRNLLVDANNMKDATYWSAKGGDGKVTIREGIAELKQAWGGPAYSETKFKQDYQSELKIGQNYTYSLDVLVPNETRLQSGTVLNFYSSIFTNGLKICDLNDFEKGKWKRVSVVTQYTGGDNLNLIRPEMNKTPSSGVVKLRRLKMEIGNKPTDYDSLSINFSEIQQQVDSIKQTVQSQDGKISSIEQTANGIQHTVQDNSGKITQITQTVDGMSSKVTDATNKVSEITQTVNGMQSTVNDNKGNISTLTQKVDGLQSKVQDAEGNLSSITQKVDGIKTEVQDNKNNISQVTQTAEALQQKVTDNENNISQVTQTSTAIQQQLQDVKGNINTITSTVEGTTQRIENVEGQITEIDHTVDGVKQTVQNQNGQLSSMQQNIDGFTHRVESMVGDVSGANLIGNKDPMVEMTATPSNVKSENHEGYAKFSTNLEGQQVAPSSAITVKEETGTKLTQQIEIHTDGQLQAVVFEKGGNATLINKEQNTWVAHASFNLEGTSVEVLKITSITVANATYVEFRRPKVEKGDYTDYKLSTTEFDKVTSEIKQTASGIQQTIESQNGKISQMTQTVDGMLSKVSEGEQKFTEIKQTVNGIQQTVQDNTGKITQTTTTVDGILNRVGTTEQEIEGGDANLIESFETTPTLTNTGNHFEKESVNKNGWATFTGSSFNNRTLNEVKFKDANGNVTRKENTQYTLSFEVNTNCDLFGENCYIKVKINDQQTQLTSQNVIHETEEDDIAKPGSKSMQYKFKFTFTPTADFTIPDIAIQTARKLKQEYNAYSHVSFRHFQIVEGTEVKGWGKQGGLKGKYSEIKQTIDGVQTTIQNQEGKIFQLTQTADGLLSKVSQGEEKYSEIKQTIDGVQTTIRDQNGKINQLTVRADGMLSEIKDNAGNISSFQHKIDSLQSKVTDNTGKWTQLSQTVNGISSIATDAKNQASYVAQKAESIQSKVMNLQNKTESAISQLEDQVQLRVQKGNVINQINVSSEDVRIDGKKIRITGQTYIDNASIDAAAIKNLDVDKIVANKASFIQKGLNEGTGSKVQITAKGIKFSGQPYTNDYDNNFVEVNSGHLKFWAEGGGVYGDSYGYIGTAKRSRFLTVTAGVVKNSSEADRSPALALRSSGQDVLVATRKSVAVSGGTVYIGNNTAQDDGYYDFYNNVYEATRDGQITSSTTDRVAIGANNEVWLRCKRSVKVNAGNDFIVDTSSSVFLRPSGDVKIVPGSGMNIQRYTNYNDQRDIRFYYEDKFGFGLNAPGLYKRTSSGSANLTITSNFNVMKTSSARKYKTAIKEIDNLEEAKKMLEISPISWIDKAEAREKGMKNCDRYVGFLADDFDDAGLTEVVDYDQDGEVESLAYDRLSVYMIQLIKDLYKQIDELKGENKK